MSHPLTQLARALARQSVRYVLIGVSGANLYGPTGQAVFTTEDFDLFLPPDADNLLQSWAACEAERFDLWIHDEPLDRPRDRWLAERIVQRRAATRVTVATRIVCSLPPIATHWSSYSRRPRVNATSARVAADAAVRGTRRARAASRDRSAGPIGRRMRPERPRMTQESDGQRRGGALLPQPERGQHLTGNRGHVLLAVNCVGDRSRDDLAA